MVIEPSNPSEEQLTDIIFLANLGREGSWSRQMRGRRRRRTTYQMDWQTSGSRPATATLQEQLTYFVEAERGAAGGGANGRQAPGMPDYMARRLAAQLASPPDPLLRDALASGTPVVAPASGQAHASAGDPFDGIGNLTFTGQMPGLQARAAQKPAARPNPTALAARIIDTLNQAGGRAGGNLAPASPGVAGASAAFLNFTGQPISDGANQLLIGRGVLAGAGEEGPPSSGLPSAAEIDAVLADYMRMQEVQNQAQLLASSSARRPSITIEGSNGFLGQNVSQNLGARQPNTFPRGSTETSQAQLLRANQIAAAAAAVGALDSIPTFAFEGNLGPPQPYVPVSSLGRSEQFPRPSQQELLRQRAASVAFPIFSTQAEISPILPLAALSPPVAPVAYSPTMSTAGSATGITPLLAFSSLRSPVPPSGTLDPSSLNTTLNALAVDDGGPEPALFRSFPGIGEDGVLWDGAAEGGPDGSMAEIETPTTTTPIAREDERAESFATEHTSDQGSLPRSRSDGMPVRRRSTKKNEKGHTCPTCGKVFQSAGHLTRHMYGHLPEGERPHGGSRLCRMRILYANLLFSLPVSKLRQKILSQRQHENSLCHTFSRTP